MIEWLSLLLKNNFKAVILRCSTLTDKRHPGKKAPGEIQRLFSVWSHTIRVSPILSFRKAANEERRRLSKVSGTACVTAVKYDPVAPINSVIWAQTAKKWK